MCNISRETREGDLASSGDKVQSPDGVQSMEVWNWGAGMWRATGNKFRDELSGHEFGYTVRVVILIGTEPRN